MAEKQETNWTTIVVVILVVLLAYILWDAYVHEDPLTKVAQGVDRAIDRTSEVVTDTADAVIDVTSDVVDGAITGAGRVLVGAVNAVGDTLIFTGEAIRIDRNGQPLLVDHNGNETKISPEEADTLMAETEARQQEQVRAATEAGVLPSPMEGEMNQNVDNIMASEEDVDSEVMNVAESPDEVPALPGTAPSASVPNGAPAEPTLDEDGNVVENFYYYYDSPRYCTECGDRGRADCNNCSNCGYCITPDGHGECVTGDANGPYFREDCIAYEHSDNGYRVYRHSPYRYLVGLPYWRRDAYYYDLRGYPRTRYVRRSGRHYGKRRSRSASRSARRSAQRTRDVVVPSGSRSRSSSRSRTSSPRTTFRGNRSFSSGSGSRGSGSRGAFRVGRGGGGRGTSMSGRVGSRGGSGGMRGGSGGGRR